MLDPDAVLYSVTDLKQYIYCPRIFYYHTCLPDVRPTTYNIQAGIDAHVAERQRAERRSLKMYKVVTGQRFFDVALQSERLALTGRLDELVDTGGELIPVDYKLASKAAFHFRIQLAAYALLLEETYQREIKRGFLYLIPRRHAEEVLISRKLRQQTQAALDNMTSIASTERMPPPTSWRQRCADCEFRRFCNDV